MKPLNLVAGAFAVRALLVHPGGEAVMRTVYANQVIVEEGQVRAKRGEHCLASSQEVQSSGSGQEHFCNQETPCGSRRADVAWALSTQDGLGEALEVQIGERLAFAHEERFSWQGRGKTAVIHEETDDETPTQNFDTGPEIARFFRYAASAAQFSQGFARSCRNNGTRRCWAFLAVFDDAGDPSALYDDFFRAPVQSTNAPVGFNPRDQEVFKILFASWQ
jgi:hypothetical protein